jgi:dTDP-4-amino-4,6-dideoxygalactose transaminase
VRQWTDVLLDERAGLVRILDENRIGCRNFWHPLHRQKPYAAKDSAFGHSIDASARGLWLASRLDMTEEQIDRVSSVLVAALRR